MPECTLETSENVPDPSKNTNEEDDRKPSPVEKTDQITSNVQLNAYEESDREEDSKKAQESKKNIWRMEKLYIWNLNWMMTWTNKRRTLAM